MTAPHTILCACPECTVLKDTLFGQLDANPALYVTLAQRVYAPDPERPIQNAFDGCIEVMTPHGPASINLLYARSWLELWRRLRGVAVPKFEK